MTKKITENHNALKLADRLGIDYDENELLVAEFGEAEKNPVLAKYTQLKKSERMPDDADDF
jgi:hypothetical protein